jgi:hypothetical protein
VGNGHRRKQPNASHSIARRVSGCGVHCCDVCTVVTHQFRVFFLIFSLSGLTRECVPTLPGDFLRPQLTVE